MADEMKSNKMADRKKHSKMADGKKHSKMVYDVKPTRMAYGVKRSKMADGVRHNKTAYSVRSTKMATMDYTELDLVELEPLVDPSSHPPSPRDKVEVPKASVLPHKGIFMALVSSFFFSISSLIVKVLVDVQPLELVIFRFLSLVFQSLPLVVWYTAKELIFPKDQRLLLMLRGVMETFTLILAFYAFKHMPLADASVIIFSVPVFVSVLARVFLNEQCGVLQSGVIVLNVVGLVLIARPPFIFGSLSESYTAENWWGMMAAILSTVITASLYIMLRKLKGIHYSVVIFSSFIMPLIITFPTAYFTGYLHVPQCGLNRYYLVCLGIFGFVDHACFVLALQLEEAGLVSVIRAGDVVFAFIWQAVFLHKLPDMLSLLGAVLVTTGVVVLGLRNWILSKR